MFRRLNQFSFDRDQSKALESIFEIFMEVLIDRGLYLETKVATSEKIGQKSQKLAQVDRLSKGELGFC